MLLSFGYANAGAGPAADDLPLRAPKKSALHTKWGGEIRQAGQR
jgi:hypothetical protein